jgi:hypothetical protein
MALNPLGLMTMPEWFWLLVILPIIFYDVVFETLLHGQTLGKKVMGIRVVKLDGSQPGVGSYIMRWLSGMIELHLSAATIAIVAIAANGRGQRLGDLAANTAVVKVFRRDKIANSLFRELDSSYQPVFPQVAQLTDRDMTIVDEAFRKAVRFKNTRLMKHLTKHLIEVLGLDAENDERLKGLNAKDFLRIVVRDYNYYTGKL